MNLSLSTSVIFKNDELKFVTFTLALLDGCRLFELV